MPRKRDNSPKESETSFRVRMPVSFHTRLKAASKKHGISMQKIIIALLPDEVERLENAEA